MGMDVRMIGISELRRFSSSHHSNDSLALSLDDLSLEEELIVRLLPYLDLQVLPREDVTSEAHLDRLQPL